MKQKAFFAGAASLLVLALALFGCSSPMTNESPAPTPQITLGGVTVDGDVAVGKALTAVVHAESSARSARSLVSYQWLRSGAEIPGATEAQYVVTAQDITSRISVRVGQPGSQAAFTSAPTLPVSNPHAPPLTGSLSVSGIPQAGRLLAANTGALGGSGAFFYEWAIDGAALPGETGPTYTVKEGSAGSVLELSVSRSGNSGVKTFPMLIISGDGGPSRAPAILSQSMNDATYTQGAPAAALSVVAAGSNLQYEWYFSTTGAAFSQVKGQLGSSFTPSTREVPAGGALYYYVEVTNAEPGNISTAIRSRTARIVINPGADTGSQSSAPRIVGESMADAGYLAFDPTQPLSVNVHATGELSYQWYYSHTPNGQFLRVNGQSTSATFIPLPLILQSGINEETQYYFVEITNRDYGKAPTTIRSRTVAITVTDTDKAPSLPASILSQPINASYVQGERALPLTVAATGDGDLFYQWYRAGAAPSGGDLALAGETGASFIPPTDAPGTASYYVSVTHVESDKRPTTVRSSVAAVTVNPAAPQQSAAPVITAQPSGATYVQYATASALSVTATGSGSLFYQWYRSATPSGSGAAIVGATGGSYAPATSSAGTTYYYVEVTNLETGKTPATARSATATVVVTEAAPPPPPPEGGSSAAVIRKNLEDVEFMQYAAAAGLSVDATGGQLSFQWFRADSRTSAGTPIAGRTSAAYVPSTDVLGTFYFYVEITNIDWWPEGLKPTTIKSSVAEVRIIENTGGSDIGSPETSPDAVVARFESYLSKADFEGLFPLRIGSPGWIQHMRENHGHAAFPNWQRYEDYYSYDNLREAIRELAGWGYVLETRDLPGGHTNYNSRGYIVNKATGKSYPVFEEDGFNAEWNQSRPVIKTVVDYGSFINSAIDNDNRRELAALLANMAHETGAGWEGAPGGEERWGFFFNEEVAVVTSGGYSDSYTSHESVEYPPVPGQSYHGRGGIQLSWNYNYGPFSILAFGDKNVLLEDPDRVAREGKLGWMSGLWFWMTPQLPKASSHDVMQSTWKPEGIFSSGESKGIVGGFGATINIINGGFEAGGRHKERRITHYRDLAEKTGADISGEKLGTEGMAPWT